MSENLFVVAGLDIGNGYVKGSVQGVDGQREIIDIPSCTAYVPYSPEIKLEPSEIPAFMDNIYDNMDVTFDSKLVTQANARRLFGRRAVQGGKNLVSFDVSGGDYKADQELSPVLTLGCVAAKALRDYYKMHNALPSDILTVEVYAALSLPIIEFQQKREAYKHSYERQSHIVTFNDFDIPARVNVVFKEVTVQPEGACANYAIYMLGDDIIASMLPDVHRANPAHAGFTVDDILNTDNTLSIDIGEGTVNFPVFLGGNFKPDVSATLNMGYGAVLTDAMDALRRDGRIYSSRKMLAEALQTPITNINRARLEPVHLIVNAHVQGFVQSIRDEVARLMAHVGASIDVVYVYGGGATPVRECLEPVLRELVRDKPLLYMDSSYSRKLNREGLAIVAARHKEEADKKAAEAAARSGQ